MDEPGRIEPHVGGNPYADPGAAPAVVAPPTPPGPASTEEISYPVEFTAKAGEYFRIWIVNLALTILTLGIYSAWAKVRKKRYFYGHTLVDGDSFEYRANPLSILKGRIIAVVLFVGYSFGGKISPVIGVIFALVLVIAMPWLIMRSLAFNAYNSAYRNIRFHFRGGYWEPFRLIIGGGLLVIVSLGIGYPYVKSRLIGYVARNHSYGKTSFGLGAITGSLYGMYFKALGLGILGFAALGLVANQLGLLSSMRKGFTPGLTVFIVGMYFTYFLLYAYLHSRTTNLTWNAMSVGPLHFKSTLGARRLAGIYLVNLVAVICTLGLAAPWAAVRTMRYRAQNLTVVAAGGLASFVAAEASNLSATGEEVGEMFDIDFGL